MSSLIAAFSDKNIVPSLFEGLQRRKNGYGEHDEVTIAALMAGRIRHVVKNEPDLSSFLQKQTLTGCLSLACFRQKQPEQQSPVHFAGTDQVALTYHGVIDNLPEIREQLFQLGYEPDSLCPCELILLFIRRYLDIEMSAREASLTALKRLKGEFAIIALFAQEKSLVVAQRGVPMMLGIKDNEMYIGSDTTALNDFVQPIVLLEENSLLILRSMKEMNRITI